MKIYFFIFMALIARQAAAFDAGLTETEKNVPANEWGAINFNTQISIGFMPTNTITTNQNVDLVVRIKNLSTNDEYNVFLRNVFLTSPGLSFVITSPSGKDLSTLPAKIDEGSGYLLWIHPGQIDGFHVGLKEFFKVNEFGTYKISLKMDRWSDKEHRGYDVISNPLSLTVVPSQ